jgi:hypothetical protein
MALAFFNWFWKRFLDGRIEAPVMQLRQQVGRLT